MAIDRFSNVTVNSAAMLAILGVMRAKDYDLSCGKSTTVRILKNNLAYDAPAYSIDEANKLFERYGGVETSAFLYAIGQASRNEVNRLGNVTP